MSSTHLTIGSKDPPMARGKLRFYSMRFCPYAQRVQLVLDAKNIPYDVVYVNLTDKPEWLYSKSPNGKVPVIQLADKETLYESLIIADYLDEKYSHRPLHSKDPFQKAKDRLLIDRFNKVIGNLYKLFNNPQILDRQHIEDLFVELDEFEKDLSSRETPFFAGGRPGMLDYMIWPWCERSDLLRHVGGSKFSLSLPKRRFPLLMQWNADMLNDDAVKKSFLGSEIHAKFYNTRRSGYPDYDCVINID